MAEEITVIRLIGPGEDAGGGTPVKASAGGIAAAGGLLGAAVSIGGKIAALLGEALDGVLKPVMSVAKALLKTLAEFLRPIAEVVIVLLRPLLAFIRPIVSVFRTQMAPFLAKARELTAVAEKLFASGKTGEGSVVAGQAALTIIAPFAATLFEMGLNMAIKVIGDIVKQIASIGIDLIAPILGIFRSDEFVNDWKSRTKAAVGMGVDSFVTNVTEGITSMKNAVLQPILDMADATLRNYAGSIMETNIAIEQAVSDIKQNITGPLSNDVPWGLRQGYLKITTATGEYISELNKLAGSLKVKGKSGKSYSIDREGVGRAVRENDRDAVDAYFPFGMSEGLRNKIIREF